MSGDDLDRLRAAFQDTTGVPPSEGPVDAEVLWQAARGELDSEAMNALLDRVALDPVLAEELALVRALADEEDDEQDTGDPTSEDEGPDNVVRPNFGVWVPGVVLLAAACLLVLLPYNTPDVDVGSDVYRAADEVTISIEQEVIRISEPVLRWEGENGRHIVRLSTEELEVIWEEEVQGTEARPPAEVLSDHRGETLLWQVTRLRDGQAQDVSPVSRLRVE